MAKKYLIYAEWDAEAEVWVASSDEVPGLTTEADTIPALIAILEHVVPELLEENGVIGDDDGRADVAFSVVTDHVVRAFAH